MVQRDMRSLHQEHERAVALCRLGHHRMTIECPAGLLSRVDGLVVSGGCIEQPREHWRRVVGDSQVLWRTPMAASNETPPCLEAALPDPCRL
jgi:hypothetical protein